MCAIVGSGSAKRYRAGATKGETHPILNSSYSATVYVSGCGEMGVWYWEPVLFMTGFGQKAYKLTYIE